MCNECTQGSHPPLFLLKAVLVGYYLAAELGLKVSMVAKLYYTRPYFRLLAKRVLE